jgi:hypothetical protein
MKRVLENREISVFLKGQLYPRVSEAVEIIGSDDPALVHKRWHFNGLPKMRAKQGLRGRNGSGSGVEV